jgi:hypothetical protein
VYIPSDASKALKYELACTLSPKGGLGWLTGIGSSGSVLMGEVNTYQKKPKSRPAPDPEWEKSQSRHGRIRGVEMAAWWSS